MYMYMYVFDARRHDSGKLYAIGGHDGYDHLGTGEVFDPLKNAWTPIATMSTKRYSSMAAMSTM